MLSLINRAFLFEPLLHPFICLPLSTRTMSIGSGYATTLFLSSLKQNLWVSWRETLGKKSSLLNQHSEGLSMIIQFGRSYEKQLVYVLTGNPIVRDDRGQLFVGRYVVIIYILMQSITRNYDKAGRAFYNLYRAVFSNSPARPYLSFAFHQTRTLFPRLAYQNPYEPEYTTSKVTYNAPIVLSLIAFTLIVSRRAVAAEQEAERDVY